MPILSYTSIYSTKIGTYVNEEIKDWIVYISTFDTTKKNSF